MISTNFFQKSEYIKENGKYIAGYNKFNMYFIEDIKNNTKLQSCTETEIVFEDGTIYSFKGDSIYRNKAKISTNVYTCVFTSSSITQGQTTKNLISVRIVIQGTAIFDRTTDYVLKYY